MIALRLITSMHGSSLSSPSSSSSSSSVSWLLWCSFGEIRYFGECWTNFFLNSLTRASATNNEWIGNYYFWSVCLLTKLLFGCLLGGSSGCCLQLLLFKMLCSKGRWESHWAFDVNINQKINKHVAQDNLLHFASCGHCCWSWSYIAFLCTEVSWVRILKWLKDWMCELDRQLTNDDAINW